MDIQVLIHNFVYIYGLETGSYKSWIIWEKDTLPRNRNIMVFIFAFVFYHPSPSGCRCGNFA